MLQNITVACQLEVIVTGDSNVLQPGHHYKDFTTHIPDLITKLLRLLTYVCIYIVRYIHMYEHITAKMSLALKCMTVQN